ncbi:MAG: hypothetical protein KGQ48_12875 [Bradyrhizobium sp.]|nr:hypothetical protein [Bradyrhizobium sp.]
MTIIAALHDPLAMFLADNFSDMVTPHDNRADPRSTRVGSIMRPCARQIVRWSGITADLSAHVPSAPCARPPGIVKMPIDLAAMNVMMMVMMAIVVMIAMVMVATMCFGVRSQRT